MNLETTLLWICIAFTVALVVQVALLIVIMVSALRMRREVTDLVQTVKPVIEKIGPIADTSQRVLEDVRKYAGELSTKANDLLDLGQKQLVRVDGVMAEAAARTRTQMDRIEMVMDDTINRFQETTTLLQNGIVRPLRQLNAVTAGVRAALAFLAQGRRTTVEQATHDEEMFI
jgi:hypothetical protein